MKSVSLFFFVVTLCLGATSCENASHSVEVPANFPLKPVQNQSNGVLPMDNPVTTMAMRPDIYTWKDLDKLFKETVPGYEKEPYFENLKKVAIYHMVKDFSMCSSADNETIAFYTKELIKMNTIDPLVLEPMLKKLDGFWTKAELNQVVHEAYAKNVPKLEKISPQSEDLVAEKAHWVALKTAYTLN